MSKVRVVRSTVQRFISVHRARFLALPAALIAIVSLVAFRGTPMHSTSGVNPLVLPAGWPMPMVPADNPITQEKFVLGRQLFYETALSGDGKTSCATCHNSYKSFAAGGAHAGAFGDSSRPARTVPRLMNLAYDTTLTWDGHIHTLEEQATIAIQKKGDLLGDTAASFAELQNNPAYAVLFTQAFGDAQVTMDRIAKAIATFERCMISGNSPYDRYLAGNSAALSASALRGMQLFFDTTKTNCSECHNNMGSQSSNTFGQIFSDNNYYRTGTFEPNPIDIKRGGGYGFDTLPQDTNRFLDAGRAAVTRDSSDVGKFRTPSLRNVAMIGPYGADGTVPTLAQVIANYNRGGNDMFGSDSMQIFNKDPRIKALNLDSSQLQDLEAFLEDLSDYTYISDQRFQDPGVAAVTIDNHIIAQDLS